MVVKLIKAALCGAASLLLLTGCQTDKPESIVVGMRHAGVYTEPDVKVQTAWTCTLKPTKCRQVPAFNSQDESSQPECWRVTLYTKGSISYRCISKQDYVNTVPGDPFHG